MSGLAVFYDGDCPVCRIEVDLYRRFGGNVEWIDIEALPDDELPLPRETLLGRFHARKPDGSWAIGVDAFQAIWRALPYWRRAAWAFSVPGLRQATELAYRGFLAWQRRDRAKRKGRSGVGEAASVRSAD